MANPSRAFISFDTLFALIPILLMVSYTLIFASFLETRANEKMEKQILFDKLVSASSYAVRVGAAKTAGAGFPEKKVYPNLIASNDFAPLEDELEKRLRMHLSMGFGEDGFIGKGTCIYRLVVYEPAGEVRKLYFCGG